MTCVMRSGSEMHTGRILQCYTHRSRELLLTSRFLAAQRQGCLGKWSPRNSIQASVRGYVCFVRCVCEAGLAWLIFALLTQSMRRFVFGTG